MPQLTKPKPKNTSLNIENIVNAIDEATKDGKATWAIMTTFSVYCGIAILSIDDYDFFSILSKIHLPIINVEIPTLSFLIISPLLLLVLQVTTLVNIEKLSGLIHVYKDTLDKSDIIYIPTHPWIGTEWKMSETIQGRIAKGNKILIGLLFIVSSCLFPVIIVIGLFFKSLILHNYYISLYLLAITIFLMVINHKIIYSDTKGFIKKQILTPYLLLPTSFLLFLIFAFNLSFRYLNINPWETQINADTFVKINLRAKDLSVMPDNWDEFKASLPDGVDMSVPEINFYISRIRSPKMRQINISYGDLSLSFLANTDFSYCEGIGTDFSGAVLDGSSFWMCNLFGAVFDDASLNSVLFSGANVSGVTVFGADLRNSKNLDNFLNDTIGDASTILPEGVKPPAHWLNKILTQSERYDERAKWLVRLEGQPIR